MFFKNSETCPNVTLWIRARLEKLMGTQLVRNMPAFHGTRKYIAIFTRAPLNPVTIQLN
jgi:hypothetical protein